MNIEQPAPSSFDALLQSTHVPVSVPILFIVYILYARSREDLIAKTLADIPTFDRDKAETEVDKFLMDCEMMNLYIQYGKEIEKNPDFVVPDNNKEEGLFSARNLVIGYLGYVVATSVPQVFRRYVAEQEVAGQWTPTHVQFLDEWIERTPKRFRSKPAGKGTDADQ